MTRMSARRRLGALITIPLLAVAGAVGPALALSASAATTGLVVYDTIPATVPANVVSQAFYATRTSEFGQLVAPSASEGVLSSVEVGFSSWACESGSWNLLNCESEPGATFPHPITVTLYSVVEGHVGGSIASVTESVAVPYRPSANTVDCTQGEGRWYDAATGTCNNGLAFTWDFDFASSGIVLPDQVIVGVEFNTSISGPDPIGTPGGYDWLNVALAGTLSAGALPDVDQTFWDSTYLGRTPGFTPETGYAASGPVMLAISVAAPNEPMPTTPPAVLPPAPQPASPDTTVTVPSAPPTAGGAIQVQASGFLPFEDVSFVWYSTPQFGGWLRADAAGVVSGSIAVPSGLAPGPHTLQGVGAVSGIVASLSITVALPSTGQVAAPVAPAVATGAAGALLGAVLIGAAILRRRRLG